MKYVCKKCGGYGFATKILTIVQREKICLDCINKRQRNLNKKRREQNRNEKLSVPRKEEE